MTKVLSFLRFEGDGDIDPERKKKALLYAAASGCFCGLGYILQKSFIRGAIYALIEVAFILIMAFWGGNAIYGFATLGSVPIQDHSLVLMVYGIIAMIISLAFVCFWIGNISGTYKFTIAVTDPRYIPKDMKSTLKQWLHDRTALLFLAPGLVAIALGVLLPLIFSICIGFTDYDAYNAPPGHLLNWVGLQNFKDLIALGRYAATFGRILVWTLIWMVLSTTLPYGLGILLAVFLNNPKIRCKKLFKLIYILPWAIPGYISILVLQSMFDTGYGLINQFLGLFGVPNIPWLTSTTPARCALILVSIWTGFSYPMMLSENIIKNISKEIVEAATLDGASPTRVFFSITFPLLMFSISPIFIMSLAGAFNNFNTIYMFTGGGPLNISLQGGAGDTDTIITWLFKMTVNQQLYNYGSALSLILFVFIAAFSIFNLRKTRTFREEDTLQ